MYTHFLFFLLVAGSGHRLGRGEPAWSLPDKRPRGKHATAGSLYDISTLGKTKNLQLTIDDLQFGNIAAPVGAVPLSARRIICERTVSPLQCGKNARRDATLGVSPHPHSGALRGWHAWVVPHGFHPWLSSLREHPAIRRGYIQRAYGAVDYKYHLAFCQMIHHLHCAARRLFLVPQERPSLATGGTRGHPRVRGNSRNAAEWRCGLTPTHAYQPRPLPP